MKQDNRGGKRAGAGRPKSSDPKKSIITIYLTAKEHLFVKKSAEKENKSANAYIRDKIL